MRIFIPIIIFLLASKHSVECAESSTTKDATKSTSGDAREKRTLGDFDESRTFHGAQPTIQRRITHNYGPFAGAATNYIESYSNGPANGAYDKDFYNIGYDTKPLNYQPNYAVQSQQYAVGYQQPQYLEAPEPIIEIIIKESNESLPGATALPLQAPKKKQKEEVQVFYVKYNKDKERGLVIDDPIPALQPDAFNKAESSEETSDEEQPRYLPASVTISPPRTTTLRTIIKPDSEQFHSNSGIHVTFNTEDKDQSGHQIQENYEGSEVQPIVSSVDQPPHYAQQLPSLSQHRHHQSDQRARAFEVHYNNHLASSGQLPPGVHRFSPPRSESSQSQLPFVFRPSQEQGLLLNYNQNQANRYFHVPSNKNLHHQRFPEQPTLTFSPPSNSPPPKFRQSVQPKPIPIPLHHSDKSASKSQQHYTNYQQFNGKPQHVRVSKPQATQNQFQFPLPQSVRQSAPSSRPLNLVPVPPNFSQQQLPLLQNTILFQQKPNIGSIINAPQFVQSKPNSQSQQQQQKQQQHHHHQQQQQKQQQQLQQQQQQQLQQQQQQQQQLQQQQQQQSIQATNAQDFNQIVSGAELVESLPKFEQHITETVPLSEINKPFSPFRQLASISQSISYDANQQPTIEHHQVSQVQQHQHSTQQHHHQQQQQQEQQRQQHQQQQQQRQQLADEEKLLLQQSIEHSRLLQHQQQQQQHFHQSLQAEQTVYQPQEGSILVPNSPQIILPVNYHSKNYYQDQFVLSDEPKKADKKPVTPIFSQKIVPGKGVSNLATDVFPELEKSKRVVARNRYSSQQSIVTYNTPRTPLPSATVQRVTHPATTTTTPASTTRASSNKVTAALPDEVPDDLRQQLLSSGILENADISILDYDKVGDVPLESLPPEHLANFYNAGGASQISSSNRVLNVVHPNGENIVGLQYSDKSDEQKHKTVPKKTNVDLKVVRFDANNQKSVTDKYIKQDAAVLPSIDIDQPYNRYLPLKVNGDQFPIPDADVLRNKKISSVVVLAPVDSLNVGSGEDEDIVEDGRYERDVIDSKAVRFLAGDSLKNLLRKPTKENFKRWLEKEAKTNIDLQSVVLLVVRNETNGQEIYMYDISTGIVNRLKGELSSAFVDVAEQNAKAQDDDDEHITMSLTDSGIFEQMPTMNSDDDKITIIEAKSALSKDRPIVINDDSVTYKQSDIPRISISSGYSVIKR